ncbi:hypothetical protein FOA52_002726 [Chlamydomonas sp. UWO 241]|nr:hypothetical protein FOA52_002726 [Chlamydomonas sp. UWO 241]
MANTSGLDGLPLRTALAVAIVASKRQRDKACDEWRARAEASEAEAKRLRVSNQQLAQLMHTQLAAVPSSTGGSRPAAATELERCLQKLLLALPALNVMPDDDDSAGAAPPLLPAHVSQALHERGGALTTLLQGMHSLQAAAALQVRGGSEAPVPIACPRGQPYAVVTAFMAGPLVQLTPSGLRDIYHAHCIDVLGPMLAAGGDAAAARARLVRGSSDAKAQAPGDHAALAWHHAHRMVEQLLDLCCVRHVPAAPQQSQSAARAQGVAQARPEAACALLYALVRRSPQLGQLVMLVCSLRLHASATALLTSFDAVASSGSRRPAAATQQPSSPAVAAVATPAAPALLAARRGFKAAQLASAAGLFQESFAVFELLDACLTALPGWCAPTSAPADSSLRPSQPPGAGTTCEEGCEGVLHGSTAALVGLLATLPRLHARLPLFVSSASHAVAGYAATVQHVAMAPEFLGSTRRPEAKALCVALRQALEPPRAHAQLQ